MSHSEFLFRVQSCPFSGALSITQPGSGRNQCLHVCLKLSRKSDNRPSPQPHTQSHPFLESKVSYLANPTLREDPHRRGRVTARRWESGATACSPWPEMEGDNCLENSPLPVGALSGLSGAAQGASTSRQRSPEAQSTRVLTAQPWGLTALAGRRPGSLTPTSCTSGPFLHLHEPVASPSKDTPSTTTEWHNSFLYSFIKQLPSSLGR